MKKWSEAACESIDASLFSGDEFYNPQHMEEFEVYLGRWNRKVAEIKEVLKEVADVQQ